MWKVHSAVDKVTIYSLKQDQVKLEFSRDNLFTVLFIFIFLLIQDVLDQAVDNGRRSVKIIFKIIFMVICGLMNLANVNSLKNPKNINFPKKEFRLTSSADNVARVDVALYLEKSLKELKVLKSKDGSLSNGGSVLMTLT